MFKCWNKKPSFGFETQDHVDVNWLIITLQD